MHEYGSEKITQWCSHEEPSRVFSAFDWENTAVLAHNAPFDVAILEWVYNAHPVFIFDSLSMALALRGVEVGNSVMKVVGVMLDRDDSPPDTPENGAQCTVFKSTDYTNSLV